MNKTWVDKHNEEAADRYFGNVKKLATFLAGKMASGYDFSDFRAENVAQVIETSKIAEQDRNQLDLQKLAIAAWSSLAFDDELQSEIDASYGEGFSRNFESMNPFQPNAYDIYIDEEFELEPGDYIITDPCYLEHEWNYDAIKAGAPEPTRFWEEEFSLAMPSIHMRDTLYGDWGCTLFKVPKGIELPGLHEKEIAKLAVGRFCADAGEVCCVRWDEVENYNPTFTARLAKDISQDPLSCHYAAVVHDFHGKLKFVVLEEEFEYDGKTCTDYSLACILDGVNTQSGEPVRYESHQTGL